MAEGHIHKHLHSMFHLLRKEETLKMAVKLESARYGRTRYLVVVSCTRKPTQREMQSQQYLTQTNAQNQRKSMTISPSMLATTANTLANSHRTPPSSTTASAASTSVAAGGPMKAVLAPLSSSTSPSISAAAVPAAAAASSSSSTTTNNNQTTNYVRSSSQILNDRDRNNTIDRNIGLVTIASTTIASSALPSLSNASMEEPTAVNTLTSENTSITMTQQQDCENTDRSVRERSPKLSAYLDSTNLNEIEESCLLGIDCNEKTTVGLVLRILGDTTIRLDGDGGICIIASGRTHIFKPVSVQAMWSALQTLHRVSAKARENNFYPGGPSHEWVTHYENRILSDRSCLNEWNAMDAIESKRPPSPNSVYSKPTEREETERTIRAALKEIIVQLDLDEVTSKYIRTRLESHLDMDLSKYKSYIDQEMLTILGQMDAPTKIFDHVYLGSEWNASNLEELQMNGVSHILNVTREIDNFFPGMFDYFNVRVYDDEKTNLLMHWDDTFRYITQAKNEGSKVLVHCKMGVSRSASVVIAYAMKAYDWTFNQALKHVKKQRSCIKPNKHFLSQLEQYQGMLLAMKNKEKLQRSKSDTNLRASKDARLLPGSEPTPLIQAFNAAAKKNLVDVFQERSLNYAGEGLTNNGNGGPYIGHRPKSWSPDNVESSVMLPKQHSLSMENLPPECTTNVRLPCLNGQNYSVSQNQVFHLQENHATIALQQHGASSVKLIVKVLESNNQKLRNGFKSGNKETWDPGEQPTPMEFNRRNSLENRSMTVKNRATICDKSSSTSASTTTTNNTTSSSKSAAKQFFNNEFSFSNLGRDTKSAKPPTSPTQPVYALRRLKGDNVSGVAGVVAQHDNMAAAANAAHTPAANCGSIHIKNQNKSRIDCNSIMLTKSKYYPQIKSRNVT